MGPDKRTYATPRKRALLAIRAAALIALVAFALGTPGFHSTVSMISLLTTMSFIGCVAIGMTFITLSGNIMSFALGATLGVTTIVFTVSLPLGLVGALLVAFAFSAIITGAQGFIVGYFRANPIIVSMAALALILGLVTFTTGGRGIYPEGSEAEVLKGNIGPVPKSLAASRKARTKDTVAFPITTLVRLAAGVDRIEFRTTVRNHAKDHRLRVVFPAPDRPVRATCSVAPTSRSTPRRTSTGPSGPW